MKDYYKILKVDPKATISEIKKAYRELAKKYHPDKNANKDAEARFKEVSLAYGVLSSPESRNQFDAFRFAGSLSQGSLVNIKIIEVDCPNCAAIGVVKIQCKTCAAKGYWYQKVKYGKSKVKSKIICTSCNGSGNIFKICSPCLGTGVLRKIITRDA